MSYITCPYCGGGMPGYPCRCHTSAVPNTGVWPIREWQISMPPFKAAERKPWECPRCHRINAPHVDHCECPTRATAPEAPTAGDET